MKFAKLKCITAIALCTLLSSAAWASTTWYVKGVSGSDRNACTSPTTACKTIGHAISLASSGDAVMVAAATYKENLTINISLRLIGATATRTIIDGGGSDTVVYVNAHVTLSRVTIRNGSAPDGAGGGIHIYNDGTLTINNSTLSGNRASNRSGSGAGGGIYNEGILTINNSTLSGNSATGPRGSGGGGGIYNGGTLTINNSTLSGNVAGGGGGISSSGSLTINTSTISGNTAFRGGGGISSSGSLTINTSTISGNTANGTIGGIDSYGGTATLQNSIVANNGSAGNCGGTMTSTGYDLSSDATCDFDGPGDLNSIDPKLGTLGYYGGPTQTIPLLSGSPAIDAGNPTGCRDSSGNLLKTDQRGDPRPNKEDSGGCDMGAYERQSD